MPFIDTDKNDDTKATVVEAVAHMGIAKAHLQKMITDEVLPRATSRALKHLSRAMEIMTEAIRLATPTQN